MKYSGRLFELFERIRYRRKRAVFEGKIRRVVDGEKSNYISMFVNFR